MWSILCSWPVVSVGAFVFAAVVTIAADVAVPIAGVSVVVGFVGVALVFVVALSF